MPDNLTREQRSKTMSRIRSRDTLPEMTLRRLLHAEGCRFRLHVSTIAGKPDLVFRKARVVVFIDGDFWHGWRFSVWESKLAPYWRQKIAGNRARDARNFRRLRRQGWLVLRIWEHQLERDPHACVEKVLAALNVGEAPVREAYRIPTAPVLKAAEPKARYTARDTEKRRGDRTKTRRSKRSAN